MSKKKKKNNQYKTGKIIHKGWELDVVSGKWFPVGKPEDTPPWDPDFTEAEEDFYGRTYFDSDDYGGVWEDTKWEKWDSKTAQPVSKPKSKKRSKVWQLTVPQPETGPIIVVSPGANGNGYGAVDKLRTAGARTIVVRPTDSIDSIVVAFDQADGVVLCGGGDINPQMYNQRNIYSRGIDDDRDALEYTLLAMADDDRKPVLGICRGAQMMAVYLGAELLQDVRVQAGTNYQHQGVGHLIGILENTRMGAATRGMKSVRTNSLHHQAIKGTTLPEFVIPTAASPDGIVEAIEHTKLPWVGIQSHPEMQSYNWCRRLFEHFTGGWKSVKL
jgi:putative glutamine amidotransferase